MYETFQIALNLEQVDNGYFKLTVQPEGKVLSVTNKDKTPNIETQDWNGQETQQWDIIPTGEKDYFKIKTRTKPNGFIGFMYLEVAEKDKTHANLARPDDHYLGQQWRFV